MLLYIKHDLEQVQFFWSRLSPTSSYVTQLVFQMSDSSTLRPLPFSNNGFMMTLERFELQIIISVCLLFLRVAVALDYLPTKMFRGSISSRWRQWSRTKACCILCNPKINFRHAEQFIFHLLQVLPSNDLFCGW